MNNKEDNLKEKFRQALVSTAKVISEDYKINFKSKDKSDNSKKTDFLNLDIALVFRFYFNYPPWVQYVNQINFWFVIRILIRILIIPELHVCV